MSNQGEQIEQTEQTMQAKLAEQREQLQFLKERFENFKPVSSQYSDSELRTIDKRFKEMFSRFKDLYRDFSSVQVWDHRIASQLLDSSNQLLSNFNEEMDYVPFDRIVNDFDVIGDNLYDFMESITKGKRHL